MLVLGLDTTGSDCSVSIVDDAVVLAHISRNIGRGHAEVLAGMVVEAFEAANLKPSDVDRLAVCTGPGSFTGLRVALSFALGFALPRGLPVVGIDALAVTAQFYHFNKSFERVEVYRDVKRNEVFNRVYTLGKPEGKPVAMTVDDMQYYRERSNTPLVEAVTVDTRILAWLAINRDPATHPAEPLYSRGPDAKLPGGKSL